MHGPMNENDTAEHLEAALQRTETDADASLKAAAAVTRALKRFRLVVHDGEFVGRPGAGEVLAAGTPELLW